MENDHKPSYSSERAVDVNSAMCQINSTAHRIRRSKRSKDPLVSTASSSPATPTKAKSRLLEKHGKENSPGASTGGIESLLPSAIGLAILACGVMAKMGFRGRATVAGIDLGTTNSVICVQAPAKGVGKIDCFVDPTTSSPIIPSVVSFLEKHEQKIGPSSKVMSLLFPHPSTVVVGSAAKRRITSHPHHTLYNAKRVLGTKTLDDPAVQILKKEVEFGVMEDDTNMSGGILFTVPDTSKGISPVEVGGYVVNHLKNIMDHAMGHSNVRSAVICVPAKFTNHQRQLTVDAFRLAGLTVARIVEEPTAAALAYGLHKKPNIDYILVYDFGGGTLDVSLLYVTSGFVDVMGSDGDDTLGGTDFDISLAQYLLQDKEGKKVVDSVSEALTKILPQEQLTSSDGKAMDHEEQLSSLCMKLIDTPLCTLSSFHTIAEQMKIDLSNQQNAILDNRGVFDDTIVVSASCLGLDHDDESGMMSLTEFCDALQPFELSISSKQFDTVVQSLLSRSLLPIQRLLQSLDLSVHDVDEIVLVGGTTRMPQIRQLVKDYMQTTNLNTHIDPDLTVAYGAASVID